MNDLEHIFESHVGRKMQKWHHYLEIYDRHFSQFRGTDVRVMEIGVADGGSLGMWRNYFGSEAEIIGLDSNEACRALEQDGFSIETGDQADRVFLRQVVAKYSGFDIVIDDGGHRMDQQIISFEELFSHVKENGIYLCEDLHTNYWDEYGGGFRRNDTFIEMSKRLVDQLNAWHSRDSQLHPVDAFTKSANSIHFYDSVVVIEKRRQYPPSERFVGTLPLR